MAAKSGTPKKNLMFLSGRAHPELAEEVAKHLNVSITPQSAYDFANSETYVRFSESVRGMDLFLLQSHTMPVNQWIMEQLLMIDSLKRASARSITVVREDVPAGALAVSAGSQRTIEGWVARKRPGTPAAEAAARAADPALDVHGGTAR